jgi:tetratricopeptide (TPR) repeat protein
MKIRGFYAVALVALLALTSLLPTQAGADKPGADRLPSAPHNLKHGRGAVDQFPLGSARFNQLVEDSCRYCGYGKVQQFHEWLWMAFASHSALFGGPNASSLEEAIRREEKSLRSATDMPQRAKMELDLCRRLHKFVKAAIPKFSLDRGFEFANVIRYGERQCLLQATLLAAVLQACGVDCGVVMVYRNPHGQESNNGHAVTLVKLADGRDALLDASEPEPFAKHQGLLVRVGRYQYVVPLYEEECIIGYRAQADGRRIQTRLVRPLDYEFVRSQFWFYRGERAPGGLLASHRTPNGLAASVNALRMSISVCPGNNLAVFSLGRAYLMMGDAKLAGELFRQAHALYQQYGWEPMGPKQALQVVRASSR